MSKSTAIDDECSCRYKRVLPSGEVYWDDTGPGCEFVECANCEARLPRFPPMYMEGDGQLDEANILVLNRVSQRLALHIEYLEGRGTRGTKKRLKLALAAYKAVHEMFLHEVP